MTETHNYSYIRNEHGTDVLKQIRKLEYTSKKKGRYTSHLRFFMQCKHKDLIPKCLKLKTTVEGNEARKIIERAEKALLNISISDVVRKKNQLEKRKQDTISNLKTTLPNNLHENIINLNSKRENTELRKSSERQKKKYRILLYGKDITPDDETTRKISARIQSTSAVFDSSSNSRENEIGEIHNGGLAAVTAESTETDETTTEEAENAEEIPENEAEETPEDTAEQSTRENEESEDTTTENAEG